MSTVKGPVRKLSLGVAAIGLLLTTALALLAVAANASSQRRLLRLQAREAAATVSASLPAVSSQLSDALTVVIATKRPSVFDHFLVQTGTSRQVTSITLWKITPKGPHLLTGTGPTPHLVADGMAKGFFAKVPVTGALYVSPILASSPPRLGYALRSPTDPDLAVYAETTLHPSRHIAVPGSSPFHDLAFAFYLGHDTRHSQLIGATSALPLHGDRVIDSVPFGNTVITIVATTSAGLTGPVSASLAWVVLAGGIAFSLAAAVVAEGLLRRRALADALAGENLTLYESERENRQILEFVHESSRLLASSLDPGEIVQRLVRLAVPTISDWCTVYLAEGDVLRRVAMAIDGHPDLAERLSASPPLPLSADLPQTRAFLNISTEILDEGVGPLLESIYPLSMEEEGFFSMAHGMCVPIVLRGEAIGVVALSFPISRREVTPAAIAAIRGLADRAAIALDIAGRLAAERAVVQTLSEALQPMALPKIEGVEIAARYIPSSSDVAGDWFEADLLSHERLLVGVGDAAGHGVDAVRLMAELRHGARALAAVQERPGEVLRRLGMRLESSDDYATALYGRLDRTSGEFVWSNAGHLPLLVLTAEGKVRRLWGRTGHPLGTPRSDSSGHDERAILAPGDALVLYTDGVVERRGEVIDAGIDSLAEMLAGCRDRSLEEIADLVVHQFCQEPEDDCCLLLVRWTGLGPLEPVSEPEAAEVPAVTG